MRVQWFGQVDGLIEAASGARVERRSSAAFETADLPAAGATLIVVPEAPIRQQ